MKRRFFFFLAALCASAGLSPAAHASAPVIGIAKPWQLGFQDPATPTMARLVGVHDHLLLYIITAISIFVILLTLFIVVRFHHKLHPTPRSTTHNTLLEVVWSVIPIIILLVIAVPSMRLHYFMETQPEGGMTLKVVGHQWYWSYEYPDQGGFGFDSYIVKDEDLKPGQPRLLTVDNAVVVPVNTVVHVHVTGADVIHSWAVPAFGVKRDAVPGRLNETWFKADKLGTFYGQCSELCGVGHGFMPITVQVVSQADFDAWVKDQQKKAGIGPKAEEQSAPQTLAPAAGAGTPAVAAPAGDLDANPKPSAAAIPEVPKASELKGSK